MDPLLWSILLLGLATLFGGIEIFVPSFGFLILCSVAALAGSVWFAFDVSVTFGACYLFGLILIVPLVVSFVLRTIPKTSVGKKFFLETPEEPPEAADPLRVEFRRLVGRCGRAVSLMMPAGRVEIDGKFYDALSDSVAIEPNELVTVVRFEAATLIVRKTDTPAAEPEPSDPEIPDPFDL